VTRFPLKVSFRVAYPMGPVTTRTEVIRVVQIGPNDHRRCLTCMSTANPRREVDVVDLSLYLVTGRHLLPPGMVSFYLSSRSLLTDSLSRVTSLLWKRSVAHFSSLHNLTTIQMQALRGGVTVVQVREKNIETAEVRLLGIKFTASEPSISSSK
jgi:hypothetical protein